MAVLDAFVMQYTTTHTAWTSLEDLIQEAAKFYEAKQQQPSTDTTAGSSSSSSKPSGTGKGEDSKLQLAVSELLKMQPMLVAPGWQLHGRQLWSLSRTAVEEYRLFGMEVFERDAAGAGGDDSSGAGAAEATAAAPSNQASWWPWLLSTLSPLGVLTGSGAAAAAEGAATPGPLTPEPRIAGTHGGAGSTAAGGAVLAAAGAAVTAPSATTPAGGTSAAAPAAGTEQQLQQQGRAAAGNGGAAGASTATPEITIAIQ